MNWMDLAWTSMCVVALLLGGVHTVVWIQKKTRWANLSFAVAATAMTMATFIELAILRAETVADYATLVRWFHVPMFVVLVSLVVFVRWHFNVGRPWLIALFCLLRLASLVANFTTGVNLQFTEITALHSVAVWGADISVPEGTPNPWMFLGQSSLLVLVIFLTDAAIQSWRLREEQGRGSAIRVTLAFAGFVVIGGAWTTWAVFHFGTPLMVTPAFMGVLVAMGYELIRDVLRNHELAQRLRLSEMHLELSGQNSVIGQWTYCARAREFTFNTQGKLLLGLTGAEPVSVDTLLAIIPEVDHQALKSALASAQVGEASLSVEFRILDAEGGDRWLTALGRVDGATSPTPGLVHGVLLDTTERRRSEARFRQVIEASPVAKLVVEKDGSIVFANAQAELIFGFDNEQLYRMNIDDLVPVSSRAQHADSRASYTSRPTLRRMGGGRELFGLHRDGHEVPLEIGIAPLPGSHGMQFLATITNISERRATERELALQRDELAHLSRVALLSELSSSLAHELNQPLTAILSNAQAAIRFMAHSPPNLQEVRESLENIVESDKRAGEVIRRLRAMLRKAPPEFQSLDINEVIEDVLRIVRSDLLNRGTEVRLSLSPTLPAINGDRVQLQQVILNLVTNGSDAMAGMERDRVLTIRTRVLPSAHVEVQVEDIGTGIPVADLEHIFSPYVTTKSDGMGLGLAVCTTIVQAHNGRLWASNNPGPGASFYLELPSQGS